MLVYFTHCCGKLKPIHLWHHNIRNDKVIQVVVHFFKGKLRIQNAFCLKAAVVQIGADCFVQLYIIVYY